METWKECYLRILAEKQERGMIPRLSAEEEKRMEARVDVQVKKLGKILSDASLSDLDCLRKFAAFLQALDRKEHKYSSRALKRYWRQKKLAQRKGKRGRGRRKRFR